MQAKIEEFLYNALESAIRRSDIPSVAFLRKFGADLNEPLMDGYNALHLAITEGKITLVGWLLDNKVDIQRRTAKGIRTFHLALMHYQDEIAELLLRRGADIDEFDDDGETALHKAMTAHEGLAEWLVQHGANVHKLTKDTKFSALAIATMLLIDGITHKAIPCLIKAGADPTEVLWKKDLAVTPLHLAVKYDSLEIVRCFVSKGINLEVRTWEGFTPLQLAALETNDSRGSPRLVTFLAKHGAKVDATWGKNRSTALHLAIERNNKEMVDCLIRCGADIERTNGEGHTPLQYAAIGVNGDCGRPKMVNFLVKLGANVNARSRNGYTALTAAVANKNKEMIACLLQNGADINRLDGNGHAPVHTAILDLRDDAKSSESFLRFLFKHGGDPNVKTRKGQTPLCLATLYADMDILDVLVLSGANVDEIENFPRDLAPPKVSKMKRSRCQQQDAASRKEQVGPPLHKAVKARDKEAIRTLLQNGADIDELYRGQPPLHTALGEAILREKFDVVFLLLEEGANINLENSLGFTPLQIAALFDQQELVQRLIARGGDLQKQSSFGHAAVDLCQLAVQNPELFGQLKEALKRNWRLCRTEGFNPI